MSGNIYKKIVIGGVGLGILAGVVGLIAAFSGAMNVSARPPHMPVTVSVLHGVFKASVGRAAKSAPDAPDLTDSGLIALGAQHYSQVCSSCHGGPGLGQSPVALSMRPRPQSLPAVVDQFEDKELYEILRNGVRLSAMPAWPADSNFGEIWSVVAFLRQLPDMDPQTYADLTAVDLSTQDAAFAWNTRGPSQEVTIGTNTPPIEEYLYAAPSTGWRPIGLQGAPVAYCAACHGADGTGEVTGGHAPNLTIHSSDFIAQRLRNYAAGKQASGIMATVASALSESQITALADHYAGLPTATRPDTASDANNALGKQIVEEGLFSEAIPGCASCHSASAIEARPEMPAIAGQNRAFLEARLHGYQAAQGTRGIVWNPMHKFAENMTGEQIAAVSSYLSALPSDAPLGLSAPQADQAVATDLVQRICVTCHEDNMTGDSAAMVPNLTLQSAEYVEWQLQLFRTNQRNSSQMLQTAKDMDEPTIEALAAYIGALEPVATTDNSGWEGVSPDLLASAEALATQGDPERGLPACSSCHGAQNEAIPVIPRLAGQRPGYLQHRLSEFANFERDDWVGGSPMRRIAKALSPDERRALADYFSALPVQAK